MALFPGAIGRISAVPKATRIIVDEHIGTNFFNGGSKSKALGAAPDGNFTCHQVPAEMATGHYERRNTVLSLLDFVFYLNNQPLISVLFVLKILYLRTQGAYSIHNLQDHL